MQHRHDTNENRRRSRITTATAAVGAAVAVWAVARFVLGIEIASPEFGPDQPSKTVGVIHVAGTALVAAVAGWGLLAVLERFTGRARTMWTVIATGALALSLGGPFGGEGITTANQVALLLMHLAVGAVLIPGLRISAGRGSRQKRKARRADGQRPVGSPHLITTPTTGKEQV